MAVLETKNMCFTYEDGKMVFEDINITIEKRSFVAILGSNGCGKTTLIQLLNGLLKPTSGQVFLKGDNLKGLKDQELYSSIGMVFQNPDDQLFAHTVYEDVAYGVNNLGIQGETQTERVENALHMMNISDLKDREVHKLSFGQKKRVAIAGILAMKPEILILDEPTAGLDPLTASDLMKVLKRIRDQQNVTVVIATHEVDTVPLSCDYVYIIHQGRVHLHGRPREVFQNKKALRDSRLRLPRIGHLMEVLHKKDGFHVDTSAMTISSGRKAIKDIVGKQDNCAP